MEISGRYADSGIPREPAGPAGGAITPPRREVADSVVLGESTPQRSVMPRFSRTSSVSPVLLSASSPAVMLNVAASAMPAGPAAVPLQDQLRHLERDNVKFFRKRRFHIPFLMAPNVAVYSSEAARLMSEGKTVQAKVGDSTFIADFTADVAQELAAFKGVDGAGALPRKELAALLKEAEAAGIGMSSEDGATEGAYGIYRRLNAPDDASPVVTFSVAGVSVMTAAADALRDVSAVKDQLVPWHDVAKTFGRSSRLVTFLKQPVDGASLEEKSALAKGVMAHVKDGDSYDALKNTAVVMEELFSNTKDGKESLATGRLYVEMLSTVGDSYYRKEYREGFDFIRERLRENPAEFRVFIDLLKGKCGIPTAVAVFRNLPQPVKDGDYKEAASHFSDGSFWSPERVEMAMRPIEGVTLQQKIDLMKGIFAHVKDSDSYDAWKNTVKDVENLLSGARDGKEFLATGKLYVEMLDTVGDAYYRKEFREGLDFIRERLRENPDEFRVFIDLLKAKCGIPTAVAVFRNLPQPVKDGDYREAASHFSDGSFWSPERVSFVMKPVEGTALRERIDLMKGLFPHLKDSSSYDAWKNTASVMENLQSGAKDGKEFLETGKLYVEMLSTVGDSYYRKEYREGFDFIRERLRENPVEFGVFIDLLKAKCNIPTAVAVFRNLPQPVKDGDYKEAASHFSDGSFWSPERVSLVMKPVEGTTLQARIDLMKGLFPHLKDSSSYDAWKNTASVMENLLSGAKDGKEFLETGKLYVEMLSTVGDSYYRKEYREGFDFIRERLRENPGEFGVFVDLLKAKCNIPTAVSVFRNLPQPVKDGDYREAASHFTDGSFWSPERVETAMRPIEEVTLQQKIDLIKGIYAHMKDSNSDSWKNTAREFGELEERAPKGKEFLALGGRYVKVLEAAGNGYYDKSYRQGLDLVAGESLKEPALFESFLRMVSAFKHVGKAADAFLLIRKPVAGEEYGVRERAVMSLAQWDYPKLYATAARSIPPGDTLEDSTRLLAAVRSRYRGEKPQECEARFVQIQKSKGDLRGGQVAEIVGLFDFSDNESLMRTVDFLRKPIHGESFDERRDVLLKLLEGHRNYYGCDTKAGTSDFAMIVDGLLDDEPLAQGLDRFQRLLDAVKKSDDAKKSDVAKLARETFTYFSRELKSGAFGDVSAEEVFSEFAQALVVGGKVSDAVSHVRSKFGQGADTTIVEGAEDVKVGGIKLRRRKKEA